MKEQLTAYFTSTRTLLYSFLLSVPLFVIYETLIIISQPQAEQIVRISVDVWMKSLFTWLGVDAVSFSLLLLLLIGFYILFRERKNFGQLSFRRFPIMLGESLIYAVIVALISNSLVSLIFNMAASDPLSSLSFLQKLALSIGAGLYEELFFRVILVSLLILLFNRMFPKKWASYIAAVTLSALLFSAVHYIGSMGDAFTLSSFTYRFLFGLLLNAVYLYRGFGIAAWTHALYDVLVISFYG